MLFTLLHSSCLCLSLCLIVEMRCQSVQIQLCHFASQQLDMSHSTLRHIKTKRHLGVFLSIWKGFILLTHINQQDFTVKVNLFGNSVWKYHLLLQNQFRNLWIKIQVQDWALSIPFLFCLHSQPHALVLPSVITAQHWRCCQLLGLLKQPCGFSCCGNDTLEICPVYCWLRLLCVFNGSHVWTTRLLSPSTEMQVAECPGLPAVSFSLYSVAVWARAVTMQYLFLCKHNTVSILGMESFWGLFHDCDNSFWVNSGDFTTKCLLFFCLLKRKKVWRVWMWGHAGTSTRGRKSCRVTRDVSTLCCLKGRSWFSIAVILCTSLFFLCLTLVERQRSSETCQWKSWTITGTLVMRVQSFLLFLLFLSDCFLCGFL